MQGVQVGGDAVEQGVHVLTAGGVSDRHPHDADGAEFCARDIHARADDRRGDQPAQRVDGQHQRHNGPDQRRQIDGQHRAFGFFQPVGHATVPPI